MSPQRRGGGQRIPRPADWSVSERVLWGHLSEIHFDLDAIEAAIVRRGPGKAFAPPLNTPTRRSAVLVALYEGADGPTVVLTKRTPTLSTHKGEMSFPGGRMDPGETPEQGALREANEEVGLDPGRVTVVGELDQLFTVGASSMIVPVVGRLPEPPRLVPNPAEVDRILAVPLAELVIPGVFHEERWPLRIPPSAAPVERSLFFFELEDETVWGATARVLVQLLSVALAVDEDSEV